jgi:hypothetical protein
MNKFKFRCIAKTVGGETISAVSTLTVEQRIKAEAGLDTVFCSQEYITAAANYSDAVGLWSCTNTSVNFDNINSNQCSVTNIPQGETILKWTITQTNSCGSNSDYITLTRQVPEAKLATPVGETNCVSGTLEYSTETGIGSDKYLWQLTPETAGAITGNTIKSKISWNENFVGTAELKVRGVNSCIEENWSDALIIVNPAYPEKASKPEGPTNLCSSNNTYTTEILDNATEYQWELSSQSGTSPGSVTGITPTAIIYWKSDFSGTAYLKVRGKGCKIGDWSDILEINVMSSVPAAPILSSSITGLCQNSADTKYFISEVSGANSYEWNLPLEAGDITGTGISASVNWSDTYIGTTGIKVKAQNVCGFSEWSNTLSINIKSASATPNVPTGSNVVCSGDNKTYGITAVPNTEYYEWIIEPVNAGVISGNTKDAIVLWNADYAGTAGVKVKSHNSCGNSDWSPVFNVNVSSVPTAPTLPEGPVSLCLGSATTNNYSTRKLGDINTYQWQISPSEAGTINGTGINSNVIWNNTFSGNALISVKAIGCMAGSYSEELSVYIYESIPAKLSTPMGDYQLCKNPLTGNYSVTANKLNSTYLWQITPVDAGVLKNSGNSIEINWNDNFSGTTQLKVKAGNACGIGDFSEALNITINEIPNKVSSPSGAIELCEGSSSVYSLSPVNFASNYKWNVYPENSAEIFETGIQSTFNWITDFKGSAYIKVRGTNICGNGEWSDSMKVTVNSPSAQDIIKKGKTMLFSLDSGYLYQWYYNAKPISEANKQYYFNENLQFGTYQVEIINKQGCKNISKEFIFGQNLKSLNLSEDFTIFPNPNAGQFKIEIINEYKGVINFRVFDASGKNIFTEKENKETKYFNKSINLGNAPKGIYFIEIKNNENSTVKTIAVD